MVAVEVEAPAVTVAIYARISHDPNQTEQGVRRQIEDAQLLSSARGWSVYDTFVDNDVSAFSGAHRPDYERMMKAAQEGHFGRIIVWQTSRLWRNRVERAKAIEALGDRGFVITSVKGPELDLGTSYGRMFAGIAGEFDTGESDVKSERQRRSIMQRAHKGRPGAVIPYGWRRVYETDPNGKITGYHDVENPEEANVVREIVRRLLSGESMRAVIDDLNARKVGSPRRHEGVEWSYAGLKFVVLRPTNIGHAVYRGEVVNTSAEWPAILDEDDYARVVALLKNPDRRQHRDGARHHLLTFGIGECGVCGGQLSRRTSPTHTGGRHALYRCNKGCVSRSQEHVDALVSAVVIEWLSQPAAATAFDRDDDDAQAARERAEGIRARLDNAADQYAEGAIDGAQLARITARLKPELDAAEADARQRRVLALPDDVEELRGPRSAAYWHAMTVNQKRTILEAIGLRVLIMPRTKSGVGFEPESVRFEWGQS